MRKKVKIVMYKVAILTDFFPQNLLDINSQLWDIMSELWDINLQFWEKKNQNC